MKALVFLLLLTFSFSSFGEYRAYRLGIRYYPEDKTQPEVEVISNLDDMQYESYYRITPQQQTRIIRHWMCWGRTDYEQGFCPEPPPVKPAPPATEAKPLPVPDQSVNVDKPSQVATPEVTSPVLK